MSGTTLLWAAAGLVLAGLLLPLAYLVLRAVETSSGGWSALLRARTLATLGRTLLLSGSVTAVSAVIAVPLAWLTTRTDLPLRRWWAVLTPLPLVIPSYVGAYLMASALGPRGLVQQALEGPLGITRLPDLHGFLGATIILALLTYPYLLLSARAALLKLDPALEEASRSLGHTPWQTFWRVTLPHLRPALGAGSLLVALYALRDFGAVSIMRYDTFTRVIYVQYRSFDRSQAALQALVLVVITLVLVALETRLQGHARYVSAGPGAQRQPPRLALGIWRWPALAFCAGVVVFSLVLPATVLLYWLVRGLAAGEALPALGMATWNSLLASSLGALVTVVAAMPLAILAVRRPGRRTRLLERLTYTLFALPGIVVALALVFFGANYIPLLYQTLPLLVAAYVLLFLPQAAGAVRTALLQIQPQHEEAARSLGRRPWQVMLTITLPLMRPGVVAGASLVFLTVMKELPATLILAPVGFRTLATGVWSAVSEAFFAQAAAPALMIVLLSSLPMALIILHEQKASA
ncbi:MAG: iron ABC transporter permease [Anaerolineales bacterium]|nr:iron ABC transporter permease [Anaerolineales bacterium]